MGEEQKVHNLTTLMADMMVKEEVKVSRGKGEQDKEIRQVDELLAELTIQTEGVVEWERIAHDWLEDLAVEEWKKLMVPVDRTTWFGFDEERRAHSALEGLMLDLNILPPDGAGHDGHEEPEPTQGGTPGCAAKSGGHISGWPDGWGGACTPPLPTGIKPQPHWSQVENPGVLQAELTGLQTCTNCKMWLMEEARQMEWPETTVSTELLMKITR